VKPGFDKSLSNPIHSLSNMVRVPNHSPGCLPGFAFKLRFHHGKDQPAGTDQGGEGGYQLGNTDKGHINGNQVCFLGNVTGSKVTRIHRNGNDPRIRKKTLMEKMLSHVDCIDFLCTLLKKAVGKSTRGRSDIDANPIRDRELKILQGALQLISSAGHIFWSRIDHNLQVFGNRLSRFFKPSIGGEHFAHPDHDLGLVSGFRKTPFDQEFVKTYLGWRLHTHIVPSGP